MRKLFCSVIVLLIMSLINIANAANIKDYPRVAVMQFGNKAIMSDGLKHGDFAMCSEYAIYQLLASGWFDLIDYEQLSNIAKMHSINMSGFVDQSTTVQLGKFASAQFMIVGNVTGLTLKASELGVSSSKTGGIGGNKNTVTANVVIRIVDIETGRIVAAGMGNGSSSSTNIEIKFNKYRKNGSNTNSELNGVGGGDSLDSSIAQGEEENNTIIEEKLQENISSGIKNVEQTLIEGVSNQFNTREEASEINTYTITIGSKQVSDIQVRNALGKAVRDAIYGRAGLMTMLNGGKPVKIKTGF